MIDNIKIYLDIKVSEFQNKILTGEWNIESEDSINHSTGEIIRVVSKYTIRIDFLKLEYNISTEKLRIIGSWNKQIMKHNILPQSIEDNFILVNELSNFLCVDISEGNIMYLECGINILVDSNPEDYIKILDQHIDPRIRKSYYHLNETMSFESNRQSLKFYNKSKEMFSNKYMKHNIRQEVENKNILRYEIRYKSKVRQTFKIKKTSKKSKSSGTMFDMNGQDFLFHTDGNLKVRDLYNVSFWNSLLLDLEYNYNSKIVKKPVFQEQDVNTLKDFKELLAIKALCEMKDKDFAIIIDEKTLSKNQKYFIRRFIKDANSSKYTSTNKLELELDDKIKSEVSRLRNELYEYNDFGKNSIF